MAHLDHRWSDTDNWKDKVFMPVERADTGGSDEEEASSGSYDDDRVARYGLVRGTDEFLRTIGEKVVRENQIDMSRGQSIVTTAGSNMGFMNAVLAIGDIGDEIILLSPYYFNHEMAIDIAGCRAVIVPTDDQYQIDYRKTVCS